MAASVYEKEFEGISFLENPLEMGSYEACVFKKCDFSKANLTDFRFVDSEFVECDLSNATLLDVIFNEVQFHKCKMLGLHFEDCHASNFTLRMENCQLDHSSFYQRKTNYLDFRNCSLKEVDFTEANMSKVSFRGSDLKDARFEWTKLEGADFREVTHLILNPENNPLKKAKFSLDGLPGLLKKHGIVID